MFFLSLLLVAGSLFNDSHDITTLKSWGPYTKNYSGVSHISDISSGCRVDFTLVPGYYRRTFCIPNELYESQNGSYPWDFGGDLSSWTYRHEVEWKDQVYVDATYNVLDEGRVLLAMHCVNNTDAPQDLLLHDIVSIQHADDCSQVATDSPMMGGTAYESYEPAVRRYDYALVYNGLLRGEKRDPLSLGRGVLVTSGDVGDKLSYNLPSDCPQTITMRWKSDAGADIAIDVNGSTVNLRGSGRYELARLDVGDASMLRISTLSKGALTIDAFLFSASASVSPSPVRTVPDLKKGEGWFSVKYEDDPLHYGIAWNFPLADVRQYANGSLDEFLNRTMHHHNPLFFNGDGKGLYTSVYQRPISLFAHSDTTVYNLIVSGTQAYVEKELTAFKSSEASLVRSLKGPAEGDKYLPGADKYAFGKQLIQANLLNNIVYPIWTQGQYIRHFTPGKNWNSLYTWDSGFIAWALSELSPELSFEVIRAYTTDASSQSAFIHHGTPLPMQFMAFEALYGKTGDDETLKYMYPRLKRYFDFMTGAEPTSTTMMPSGLLRTWDYFYSSGGWDDYPPQEYLRLHNEGYPYIAPMVSTSFYIRAGKIMKMFASHLGLKADVRYFESRIALMEKAVQTYAWDPEAGYFGYVVHDAQGRPTGLFRWPEDDKTNFNMGLDGASPLIAGICTPEQESSLMSKLFDPEHLWTRYGISTVDLGAPYFRSDGYWNGCVWMSHQLVLWKTMLDEGRPDLAEKIAYTALNIWEAETERTYRSLEHFMISSGRGKGWHNFSGLSSPILNWFSSYYKQGTVSSGFDVLISGAQMSPGFDSYDAQLEFDGSAVGKDKTLILCMDPAGKYSAKLSGRNVPVVSPRPGLIYVTVKASAKPVRLTVSAID